MEFGKRGRRRGLAGPDSLPLACARAAGLAPGGMVLGYLGGRAAARIIGDCPLAGFCSDFGPVLVGLACGVLGMGVGNTLASLRVRYWWEGVVVWAVGITASLGLVTLVGSTGATSIPGLLVVTVWLVIALVLAFAGLRPRGRPDTMEQSER
jgi:hypothetical protein